MSYNFTNEPKSSMMNKQNFNMFQNPMNSMNPAMDPNLNNNLNGFS